MACLGSCGFTNVRSLAVAAFDLVYCVGISVTVSVPSNKVRVVNILTKNVVKIISLGL